MVYAKRKNKRSKSTEAERPREEEIRGIADRFVNAIVVRWKPIGGAILGVAVILGSISAYDAAHASKENSAAALLYDAEAELPDAAGFAISALDADEESRRAEQRAAAIPEFQKVLDEHGNTVGADIANLEMGHVLLESGDVEGAAARYGQAAESKSRMVKLLATSAHATALESLGRNEEAVQALRVLATEGSGAIKEYAYVDLIRVQEISGDVDGALATAREFEIELPDSPLLDEVQSRIYALAGAPTEIPAENPAEIEEPAAPAPEAPATEEPAAEAAAE